MNWPGLMIMGTLLVVGLITLPTGFGIPILAFVAWVWRRR